MRRVWLVGVVWGLIGMVAMAQGLLRGGGCGPSGCPTPAAGSNASLPPLDVTPQTPVTPLSAARTELPRLPQEVLYAIARVYVLAADGGQKTATGVLLWKDESAGWVVTSASIVRGQPKEVYVWFPKGGVLTAEVEEVDEAASLGLLRVDVSPSVEPVTLAEDVSRATVQAQYYGYENDGRLFSQPWTVVVRSEDMLESNQPPRWLGGPVYGPKGGVIGITTETTTQCAGVGPLRRLRQRIQEKLAARRALRIAKRQIVVPPPKVIVEADRSSGEALGTIANQQREAVKKLDNLDRNVEDIRKEVVSDAQSRLNPVGVVAMLFLGVAVGAVLFFASFRHTPIR